MKRKFAAIVVFVASALAVAPQVDASTLRTCKQILAKYPNGVAQSRAGLNRAVAAGYARPVVNAKVYAGARRLDRAKDGTVCVVEANKRTALPGLPAPASTSANDPQRATPAAMSAAASAVEAAGGTCLVAMRDERIVGEWYAAGRTAATRTIAWSSGKPLTTAVVGAAIQLGRLRLDQPVADFVPEWKGTPKAAITVRHLLTHTSGLKSSDEQWLFTASAGGGTRGAIALPLGATPGTTFVYATAPMQALVRVVERAVGEPFATFAEKYVLRPTGMASSVYKGDDSASLWVGGDPIIGAGLETTCRDLARLGRLFQQGGEWAGRRIFPADLAALASSPLVTAVGTPSDPDPYGLLLRVGPSSVYHRGACGQQIEMFPNGMSIGAMTSSRSFLDALAGPACGLIRGDLFGAVASVSTSGL
jgi:CubicO group peptidase (beta-lactamase class C family)